MHRRFWHKRFFYILITILLMGLKLNLYAQNNDAASDTIKTPLPFNLNIELESSDNPKDFAKGIQILILLTILSLAPSILILVTSFTRISVILNLLKRASGLGQQPSAQLISGLSLFLTVYIMANVGTEINEKAIKPYLNEEISQKEALSNLLPPLRKFMFKYTREKDLALFVRIAKLDTPQTRNDIPIYILIPAYVISELKTAFQVGFVLFLPFLIIDMVVASILLSMGMIVLPPITISTPFKVLLFVMVDGWHLVIRSITMGFN